jgi:hypothetical protein
VFSNMVMAPASHRGWEGQARKAGQQASGWQREVISSPFGLDWKQSKGPWVVL